MERVTSKTNDAYVEFMTLSDAMRAVEKHKVVAGKGRLSRLGDRHVDIELSSQTALMKDLFPGAKGIFWDGAFPNLKPFSEKEPWNNFKGFVSDEEMTMLVKHVEVPQRVSLSSWLFALWSRESRNADGKPVAFLAGLPPASLRDDDQHHQEVALV